MPADVDTPKYAVPPEVPPVVALALIVILNLIAPAPFLPRAVSLALGIPLLVLGLVFWAWGVSGLLRRGETPDPRKATTQLVTDGPFRLLGGVPLGVLESGVTSMAGIFNLKGETLPTHSLFECSLAGP